MLKLIPKNEEKAVESIRIFVYLTDGTSLYYNFKSTGEIIKWLAENIKEEKPSF